MQEHCKGALTFTRVEKVVAAIPFNASILIGAFGLSLMSWTLTAAYLSFAYIGVLVMMRYVMCPRCPHLLVGNDCLNMPVPLVKLLIDGSRSGPLNIREKLLHRAVKYGILVIPLYWLLPHLELLIPFVALYFVGQATFVLHFCKHCENKVCMDHRNVSCRY